MKNNKPLPFWGAEMRTSTPVAAMSTHMQPLAMQSSTRSAPAEAVGQLQQHHASHETHALTHSVRRVCQLLDVIVGYHYARARLHMRRKHHCSATSKAVLCSSTRGAASPHGFSLAISAVTSWIGGGAKGQRLSLGDARRALSWQAVTLLQRRKRGIRHHNVRGNNAAGVEYLRPPVAEPSVAHLCANSVCWKFHSQVQFRYIKGTSLTTKAFFPDANWRATA